MNTPDPHIEPSLDDDLKAVQEILRRKPSLNSDGAQVVENENNAASDETSASQLLVCVFGIALLVVISIVFFYFWMRMAPTSGNRGTNASTHLAKGYLSADAKTQPATLFYRAYGAKNWRYVECSPKVKLRLTSGTYLGRIEGVGGKVIAKPQQIQIRRGQESIIVADD